MTTWRVVILILVLGRISVGSLSAENKPNVQNGRTRKLLIGDYSVKKLALVNQKGEIEWQVPIRNIHDAWQLPNGNILYQNDWTKIIEMTPDQKVVWTYDAGTQNGNQGKKVEVHAFQRLSNGHTMIVESGPARIIEVDFDGKIHKQIALKIDQPNPHTDTRLVRKLANGNYLVSHEGDNQIVREYAGDGAIVWEYRTGTKVYSAIRLENGNTLIGTGDGHRVIEVDQTGKTVWSVEENELPGIKLAWVTMVERLPNGNTFIVNCHGDENNPQLLEVDKEKKVVWTFKDFDRFGNSLPVARILE